MTTPEDRLRSELAALADVPMPPDVADRIARAATQGLPSSGGPGRAESSSERGVVSHPGARTAAVAAGEGPARARRRPIRVVVPLAAAAVAVVLAGVAAGSGADAPRPVGQEDDLRATGGVAFGRDGAGAFADPVRRRACLAATGDPEPDATLLGGMPYAVDGTPGTLLVLGTPVTGRYRLVVVDPACERMLARTTAGR